MPKHSSRNLWVLLAVFALLCGFNGVKKRHIRVVFIGDSITQGATIKDPARYAPPAAAAAALTKMALIDQVEFFNAGKSGATTLDFLPGTRYFAMVTAAADRFNENRQGLSEGEKLANVLLFSIMLGTNDSAIEGTHGAPVAADVYQHNLRLIIDSLLHRYPDAKFVIHMAPWYSDNTYNGAKYLIEGRNRLNSYTPKIEALVRHYKRAYPDQDKVLLGDQTAYGFFEKNYRQLMVKENGHQGAFYLHPNKEGAAALGKKWAKAIHKLIMKTAL